MICLNIWWIFVVCLYMSSSDLKENINKFNIQITKSLLNNIYFEFYNFHLQMPSEDDIYKFCLSNISLYLLIIPCAKMLAHLYIALRCLLVPRVPWIMQTLCVKLTRCKGLFSKSVIAPTWKMTLESLKMYATEKLIFFIFLFLFDP